MADASVVERCDRANTYVLPSWEFEEAFRIIDRGDRREVHLSHVKLLLLGQALELAMKGWLILKEGTSVADLRQNYGHDLDKLASAIEPYCPLGAEWRSLIAYINENYMQREYQYPEGRRDPVIISGFSPLVAFADMIRECRDLLSREIVRERDSA